jgi:hypothetical protein
VAAYQATTASTVMIDGTQDYAQNVFLQNRGPNSVWVEFGAAATVAGGVEILANGGWLSLLLPPQITLNIICTVLQATPLDTRYLRA